MNKKKQQQQYFHHKNIALTKNYKTKGSKIKLLENKTWEYKIITALEAALRQPIYFSTFLRNYSFLL